MTLDFWWVRHGPTHAKALIGHTDIAVDLSDLPALDRLKSFLPMQDKLFSSDLIRASETAQAISNISAPVLKRKGLREMNFGDWEGKSFEVVAKSDPEFSRGFWENPGDTSPPNGECWNVFSQRIHSEIDTLISLATSKHIVVVAHFGVILAALQLAGGFSNKSVFSFKINNLSVTRLCYHSTNAAWSIRSVNQVI